MSYAQLRNISPPISINETFPDDAGVTKKTTAAAAAKGGVSIDESSIHDGRKLMNRAFCRRHDVHALTSRHTHTCNCGGHRRQCHNQIPGNSCDFTCRRRRTKRFIFSEKTRKKKKTTTTKYLHWETGAVCVNFRACALRCRPPISIHIAALRLCAIVW